MVFFRVLTIGLLLLCAVMLPVAAQTGAETVRVYTNADLERLEPLAVDSAPVARHDEAEWEFVTEFLEREQAKIDADRAHRLEQRRVAIEEGFVGDRRSRSGYRIPYGIYPYGQRYKRVSHHGVRSPAIGGRIVPLHARPSQAQVQRAKAVRRSGTDAFPSNSRARARARDSQ